MTDSGTTASPSGLSRRERELLLAVQSGDGDAFGRLVDPLRRELQAHCYRMLGHPLWPSPAYVQLKKVALLQGKVHNGGSARVLPDLLHYSALPQNGVGEVADWIFPVFRR